MNYEYEGKELLKENGIPIPWGKIAFSIDEAKSIAKEFGINDNKPLIVKAQILGGKRGKRGLIKRASSIDEVSNLTKEFLARDELPEGKVIGVYLEEFVDIEKEYYFSVLLDRKTKNLLAVFSVEGGINIEQISKQKPDTIKKSNFEIGTMIFPYHFSKFGLIINAHGKEYIKFTKLLSDLANLAINEDLLLLEINPLVRSKNGDWICVDSKIVIDSGAAFRHPDWRSWKSNSERQNKWESIAEKNGLAYVQLDGDIGMISCGAGLSMTTCDVIEEYGGKAANFLDVGGGATPEKVKAALEILFAQQKIKGIFINVFGGITRCDLVAKGIIEALQENKNALPIVVRLIGTNDKEGVQILRDNDIEADTEMIPAIERLMRILKLNHKQIKEEN